MKDLIHKIKNAPFVSFALVIINVAVFFVGHFLGDIIYQKGCLNLLGVVYFREYGRILWSMFLHADVSHLMNNMIVLLFMGAMLEKVTGHVAFAASYFCSGVGGAMLSLLYKYRMQSLSSSIGASGAIFGMDGLLLALVLFSNAEQRRISLKRVLLMIVLSVYSGYTGQNIDNAAHIGGLLTGFIVGVIYCLLRRGIQKVKNLRREVSDEY